MGKRGILIPSRVFSQLVEYRNNVGRSKDALKRLYLGNKPCGMLPTVTTRFYSNSGKDPCGGGVKATDCHLDYNKLVEPCEQVKLPSWKGDCKKVCLPCCKPITVPISCSRVSPRINLCSGTSYKYPSFTETVERIECGLFRSDCCYPPKCKFIYPIGFIRKIVPFKEYQKDKLGVPKGSKRFFSTSARLLTEESKCDPKPKETKPGAPSKLPCLRSSGKRGPKMAVAGKVCGGCQRICMPCCKPARDPPLCEFPYIKPPCKRIRPPRPAFSECQAERVAPPVPCECQYPVLKRYYLDR
ncbi:hypothetical protein O3M35_012580 [Rhynocoris fuscipes]|uniref:ShKT domain-containing protein n=1 Tax=Rhynocoris fuscipes TaxID=488301 RepID=A0AAW1CWQ9_9HEMI